MGCIACERAQEAGQHAFVPVGDGKVLISECPEHTWRMVQILQDQVDKGTAVVSAAGRPMVTLVSDGRNDAGGIPPRLRSQDVLSYYVESRFSIQWVFVRREGELLFYSGANGWESPLRVSGNGQSLTRAACYLDPGERRWVLCCLEAYAPEIVGVVQDGWSRHDEKQRKLLKKLSEQRREQLKQIRAQPTIDQQPRRRFSRRN